MYLEKYSPQTQLICYHCGEACNHDKIYIEDKFFCCDGCKMVYEILNQNSLCTYYDLNDHPGLTQKIHIRKDKFSFLDDEKIAAQLIQFTDNKQTHITFYLPQMHCSSCLWLLENLNRINKGVISSRVNFAKKEAFIVYDNITTTLRNVVETLTAIGYEPHISLQDAGKIKASGHDKTRLLKIGVAGFCFANIMMLSLPEYFSFGGFIHDKVGEAFRYINLVLALPVFFYSASEFFISAWKGLRNKFLNIDAPIALAIIITFGRSLYEMFVLHGNTYFDSMSGIVFFMLVGRWAQDKTQRAIAFDRDFKSFFPIAINVKTSQRTVPTLIQDIQENDVIEIYNNELIPADAILSKGHAEIDYSFVTGESLPVMKEIGELVYAGGKQMGEKIELVVAHKVSQSYLTNLWNKDVFREDKKESAFIHNLSNYFTSIVFIISAIAAVYWLFKGDTTTMWNALTTILIIACPCALLLSSTFTNGNILRVLSKNKFYLRHPDVIQKMAQVDHIVFDKTGTLTQTKKFNVSYHGKWLDEETKMIIASLLDQSTHPLSRAIFRHLEVKHLIPVQHFKNIPGKGIEGWINEMHIKIGSPAFVNKQEDFDVSNTASVVTVKIDNETLGEFRITNLYRSGLKDIIPFLQKKYIISVLSGDNDAERTNLQHVFGNNTQMLFNKSPQEKLDYIESLQQERRQSVMMIGDGLNDAGALRQSDVGIAITEDNNNFTPACDGILDASGFSGLDRLLRFTKSGKFIIIASFIISVVYNIIGLYFAVQGALQPVIAAILMPASSISIIVITYGLTEVKSRLLKV